MILIIVFFFKWCIQLSADNIIWDQNLLDFDACQLKFLLSFFFLKKKKSVSYSVFGTAICSNVFCLLSHIMIYGKSLTKNYSWYFGWYFLTKTYHLIYQKSFSIHIRFSAENIK